LRLCCVSHSARGLVGGVTGGAERQVALLALSLAAGGHEVSLVVPGYRGEPETIDGVRLVCGWEKERGVRVLRSLTYRAPTLYRVLSDQRADVYYVRGRAYFTPVVMLAARRAGAVSLLGLANDRDLLEDRSHLPYGLAASPAAAVAGRLEYAYFRRGAIDAADWIITQHDGQSALCARMGLRHLLIPNIVSAPADGPPDDPQEYDAVWVGNVHRKDRSRKGLVELVELAERASHLRFAVAGLFSTGAAEEPLAKLAALPNVAVFGALTHEETLALIARSRVVVNTSAWEGLSNVMLEGWTLYKPCVSLRVDPNGLLSCGELGGCAGGDLERMAEMLARLVADEDARREVGTCCAAHVARTHGADAVRAQYAALFDPGPDEARPA
jgi:glycosyltransferase involved in cell wall biosynthesis